MNMSAYFFSILFPVIRRIETRRALEVYTGTGVRIYRKPVTLYLLLFLSHNNPVDVSWLTKKLLC